MPDSEALSLMVCFGFVFFLIPTIICIVLAVRLSGLRDRVGMLELRLAEMARELLARPRAVVPPVPHAAAPAPHVAPSAPAPTPAPAHAPAPVAPQVSPIPLVPEYKAPAAAPAAPTLVQPPAPTPAVAAHATTDNLVARMEQLRQREDRAATAPVVAPAQPAPAAPSQAAPPPAAPAHLGPPKLPSPTVIPPAPAPAAPPIPAAPHAPHLAPAPVPPTHAQPVAAHAPAAPPAAQPPHPPAPRPAIHPASTPPAPVLPLPKILKPLAKPKSLEFYIIAAFIVIGAITLALAAIFLVKIGIEKGVFGPALRDGATALCGLLLIGVGQWRRRFEAFWSQGLTAAGIVALFAAAFAATSVHHFLTPLAGFALLGLTTAGAVAMSLQDWSGTSSEGGRARGGFLIATLGLIGGFITPILVNSGRDDVPGLFGYLILLHVGLVFATRLRGWSILAAASVVLSSLWLIFWTLFKWNPVTHASDGAILGMFMLATVVTLVLSSVTQPEKWRGGKTGLAATILTWLGVGLGLLASCLLLGKSHYDDLQWTFFAMLVLGAFVLARLRPIYEAMAWLASIAVLAMLTAWGFAISPMATEIRHLIELPVQPEAVAEHLRFQAWLLGFGLCTVLAAFACQWKSAAPVRWAVLANLLALAYVAVGYWLVPALPRADAWGWLPVAVAAGLAVLMTPCVLRRDRIVTGEACLLVYAHTILALLLLAAPMGLSGSHLTAAWAALLPLTALAIWRLKLPGLSLGLLAATLVVGMRAMMIPTVFDAAGEGRTLWWNPVIWSYGSILVSMGLAAFILDKCAELPERWRGVIPGPKVLSGLMQAGAAVAAFLLLTLEVRWGFHDGKLDAHSALLAERGTFALGWLLLAATLTWIGKQISQRVLIYAGEIVAILGLVYAVIGLVFITNPLWWQWQGVADDVGGIQIFNMLLFAYGMPAAACALVAYVIGRADPERRAIATVAAAAGVVLLFTMVSLQVRQGFVGSNLTLEHAGVSFREFATYASAWLALGAVCLAVGRRFRRDVLWRAGNWICSAATVYAIGIVGVAMSPLLHHQSVGQHVIFNDLLFAYGLPILLAALAAWIADPRSQRVFGPLPAIGDRAFEGAWSLGAMLRSGIMVLMFILVTTEVRQAFQGEFLDIARITFFERSLYPTAWLVLAAALLAGGIFGKSPASRAGGMTIAVIGMGFVLLINTLLLNPVWTGEHVGTHVIFNDLLVAFGLPFCLCALLAWFMHRNDPSQLPFIRGMAIGALVLLLALVSLEVRQGYAGESLVIASHPLTFLEHATYNVVWMALAAAWLAIGLRWRMEVPRRAGAALATGGILHALAVLALAANPIVRGDFVGDWKIFNQILFAYGTPAALAALIAWIVDPRAARFFGASFQDQDNLLASWGLGRLLRAGIVALLFVLVGMEVRQAFQGAYLHRLEMNFWERGTYGIAWLLLSGALLAAGDALKSQAGRRGGLLVAGVGLGWSLFICALLMNPLWMHESVGAVKIFNGLLYAYGIPAAAAGILSGVLWYRKPWSGNGLSENIAAWIAAIASLVLVFFLVTLEVQHTFRGDQLSLAKSSQSEFVAYSLAWATLGIIYLAFGIWRKSLLLRWASLVMMLITIPKVFLADMPALQDLQRVLSFAGLGVSLMILGFVYFRYVFPRPSQAPSPVEPPQPDAS